MASTNSYISRDLENHSNLTTMWRALGASTVPGLEGKGGLLAEAWPDRVWLDLGEVPSRSDLEAIDRARGERRVLLPLWERPSHELQSLLRHAGYEAVLTQGAMSLDLAGRLWTPSRGVDVVRDPELLPSWTSAVSAAFGYAFDSAVSHRLFVDPNATLFAATSGGEISGTGVVYMTGGTAGVHWVGVVPAFRRRGVARAVMNRILSHVAESGRSLVTLQASEAGRHLYDSLGFVGETTIHTYATAIRSSGSNRTV